MSRWAVALLALAAAACGGGSPSGPSVPPPSASPGPSSPPPSPPPGSHDVTGLVFYDENGNGRLDASEAVRVGGVEAEVAGRTGRSEATTGRFVVHGVAAGAASGSVRAATLPPFYLAGSPVGVQVPQAEGSLAALPVTLPIGTNRPNRYMAFGDSITIGDGSRDGSGYRQTLERQLEAYFGAADVVNEGTQGTTSLGGAERIRALLGVRRPAFTLILYGTNDWNDCKLEGAPCYTVDNLRSIVRRVKEAQSLPVLSTVLPANPDYPDRVPPERNAFVAAVNDLVRPMAREEGALLVDLHAAFLAEPDLIDLFADHVHPNDLGYAIITREFFVALTTAPTASSLWGFER